MVKDFYAPDRFGKRRHWWIISEEPPENGQRVFLCCLYYQRNRKWWPGPVAGTLIYRKIEYFGLNEVDPNGSIFDFFK